MTKFIMLNESLVRGDTKKLLLPVDRIIHVQGSLKESGRDTHIRVLTSDENKSSYYFVKETVEEVWEKLNADNSMAPIIMTADEALKYYERKSNGLG